MRPLAGESDWSDRDYNCNSRHDFQRPNWKDSIYRGQRRRRRWLYAIGASPIVGGSVGLVLAKRVEMTAMPQLVAMLHSFVGLAAVLVGLSNHLLPHAEGYTVDMIHKIEIFLGVLIGGYTFTGSVVAWGKLEGRITSTPWLIPRVTG